MNSILFFYFFKKKILKTLKSKKMTSIKDPLLKCFKIWSKKVFLINVCSIISKYKRSMSEINMKISKIQNSQENQIISNLLNKIKICKPI